MRSPELMQDLNENYENLKKKKKEVFDPILKSRHIGFDRPNLQPMSYKDKTFYSW